MATRPEQTPSPRWVRFHGSSERGGAGPPGRGPSRSPPRLCRAALVSPAPLGQNQARRNHHRPWHLLSVPASRADFRFQKYVAWLLSIEFNNGLCEAGRAGPGWAGALRLLKARLPSRSGLCSSGSARGSWGLLRPCAGLLPSFRTPCGTCLPGPGLLCLPFLSTSTWNQAGRPSWISPCTTCVHNVARWRNKLCGLERLPRDHQALRSGDSSQFNRWDPQVPQPGTEG